MTSMRSPARPPRRSGKVPRWPPPKSCLNTTPKCSLITRNASWKRSFEVRSMPLMARSISAMDSTRSWRWAVRNASRSSSSWACSTASTLTGPRRSIFSRASWIRASRPARSAVLSSSVSSGATSAAVRPKDWWHSRPDGPGPSRSGPGSPPAPRAPPAASPARGGAPSAPAPTRQLVADVAHHVLGPGRLALDPVAVQERLGQGGPRIRAAPPGAARRAPASRPRARGPPRSVRAGSSWSWTSRRQSLSAAARRSRSAARWLRASEERAWAASVAERDSATATARAARRSLPWARSSSAVPRACSISASRTAAAPRSCSAWPRSCRAPCPSAPGAPALPRRRPDRAGWPPAPSPRRGSAPRGPGPWRRPPRPAQLGPLALPDRGEPRIHLVAPRGELLDLAPRGQQALHAAASLDHGAPQRLARQRHAGKRAVPPDHLEGVVQALHQERLGSAPRIARHASRSRGRSPTAARGSSAPRGRSR